MRDYREDVERALRSIECHPVKPIGLGIWRWYSPRTETCFNVDATIPTASAANETLRAAGHGPMFPERY